MFLPTRAATAVGSCRRRRACDEFTARAEIQQTRQASRPWCESSIFRHAQRKETDEKRVRERENKILLMIEKVQNITKRLKVACIDKFSDRKRATETLEPCEK
jgi:hypothetical protein